MKAKRPSINRAVPVPRRIIDGAWKRFAAAFVVTATVMPAIPGAAAAHAPGSAAQAAGSLTGGDWVLGSGGSWSFGAGWSSATTEDAGEAPDSISLMAWMIEDVRRHWGLSQEGSLDPVAIVEHWVSGASTVDYSLTTGADDWNACHLLLEGFEPSSGRGTTEDVLAGFLTQPSVCGRLWAAAAAWSQSGAGEYPVGDHTRLAEALWRGSGFGSGDDDGFAALYYEPDDAPYCGHLPTDLADDEVPVPVPCPLPPSVQVCLGDSQPTAVEEDAESAVIVSGLYEVPPSSGSFDVPQCSAIERAVNGKPNASQYQWTARWWDPDGNPVGSPGADSSVEDDGNCERPTGGGWVLSLCADEKQGGAVVRRNVLQADWSWTLPPPAQPRSETLLAAISPPDERTGISRGEPRLNCNVPESRLSLAESQRREAQWVHLYTFRVDPCMVDATLALFELAESHGIQLIVGPNGGGRTWGYQMYLRRKNCPAGWSDEQFANGPAPQCSPVTALPGKSRHNAGMAIDFNCNSFDHPCYRWLNEHASRLGFHDLPRSAKEPWHWAAAPHH